MAFPFSFSLPISGITNPFAAAANPESAPPHNFAFRTANQQPSAVPRRTRRPPSPLLLPPASRKRGWVPSTSELSRPAPMHTSTSGYLDTPAKYRDIANDRADENEIEELVADLPPTKRRRTLAGSLISTALSAALIGTAVGLTVYRLWRDRGKNPEALPPPPPYEQGEWVPPEPETAAQVIKSALTPRSRKSRPVASRRTVPRHRKTVSRPGASTSTPSRPPIPPEFNFASGSRSSPKSPEDADVDEQMSWMGDRLAHLIAEGQKALGREIVVMSEVQADEVDDGSGAWEDERTPISSRPVGLGLPPYSPHTPQLSRIDRGVSVDSDARSIASNCEEESAWQSPEIRESMERARMQFKQKRGF